MPDITKLNIRIFSYSVIALVLLAVITGLVVVESPATEQARRLDSERVSHLSMIQSYTRDYWIKTNRLPATLNELRDPLVGIEIPRDTETGAPYEYRVLGPLSFELCATFGNTSQGTPKTFDSPYGGIEGIWDHPAGRHCFVRTINPELIRPIDIDKPIRL